MTAPLPSPTAADALAARSRRRLATLIALMAVIVLMSGGISMYLLYDTAVEEQHTRLHETAQTHARLIEAVARHEASLPAQSEPFSSRVLAQIRDAHERSEGFGRTGELVLAQQRGDAIVFLLNARQRQAGARLAAPVELDGDLAEPMRRALRGQSGTTIATDYRGVTVLAAYEPVSFLDMGLVAKIDLAEVRQPFIRAAVFGGIVGMLAILVSAFLFVRATIPLVQRAKESEAYSRTIVSSAADGIITVDHNGRIASINPAGEEIFGYRADEVIGRAISDLMPSPPTDDRSDTHDVIYGIHADESLLALEVTSSQIAGPAPAQYSLFVRDVSERRRLEAELRHAHKMEAIGTLASGIAHDFNNLLMGVSSSAELALSKVAAGSPVGEHLQEIKSAILGGASITRQLLTFGRRSEAESTLFELNDLVAGTERMLSRIVGDDVTLHVTLCSGSSLVLADRGEIEQILFNLVGNARHAMPSGGKVEIEIAEAGDYLCLSVTDTGAGMTDETKARIFEPFFTTKGPGQGTGLGLASVYGIVQRNHGQIEVDSQIGKGTTFRILWPRASSVDLGDSRAALAERLRGDETIMLVEDEPLVRQSLRHHLERAGYRVVEAGDAETALELLHEHADQVDLLLTDVVLRGMSGPQLAERLDSEIPTVYMSAYPNERLVRDGHIEAGTASLQKPFTETLLLQRLRDVLGHRAPSAGDHEPPPPADNQTILLIEDNTASRTACSELLGDLGYRVLPAATGAEALSLCGEHATAIDIVVADLGLPDISGPALVSEIHRRLPSRAVLYMSGRNRDDPELRELLERPLSSFVQKPVDFDALASAIETLLAQPPGNRAPRPPVN